MPAFSAPPRRRWNWHRRRYSLAATVFLTGAYAESEAQSTLTSEENASPAEYSEQKNPSSLEEIIVTAEKRDESLSRTPIAVSVLTPEQLATSGVVALKDLISSVPNLEIGTTGAANSVEVTIRGIGSNNVFEDGDPAVPTYIDGVYVPRTQGLTGTLYDLERIEVLRGPQGTLYGRNSTAGSINVLTASPIDRFAVSGDISYGNYDDVLTHGMLNVPVTDTLAVRAAFSTHHNDGYFNSLGTTSQNYGRAADYGGRLTALWRPGSNFSWRVSFDYFESNGTPTLGVDTGNNGSPTDGRPVFERPTYGPSDQPYNLIRNSAVRSRIQWDVTDRFLLTYTAGYQHLIFDSRQAYDTGVDDVLTLGTVYNDTNDNTSHEVDLQYNEGPWQAIVGANYFYEKSQTLSAFSAYVPGFNIDIVAPHVTADARGVFAQTTYALSALLRLTAGVRYSSDSKSKADKVQGLCPLNSPVVSPSLPESCFQVTRLGAQGHWSATTWKGGLTYDVANNSLVYATVSTGYKAGGLNDTPNVAAKEYSPERVVDYELGAKSRLLHETLALSTSLFYMDYSDLQVSQVANTGGIITENAAKARIYGAEIELAWNLTLRDRLTGFVDYLCAKYVDYSNAVDQQTNETYPSLSGNVLPKAPRESGRLQYEHDFVFQSGAALTPSLQFYVQSESYLREFNLPIDRVPGYTKTNFMLTFVTPRKQWMLQAFVQNIEDKAVRNAALAVGGNYFSYYNPPRLFGARVSFSY
jgi:iron complex outermembrane receptor protein